MKKRIEMIGFKFGRLTVVEIEGERKAGRHPKWRCDCDCGGTCVRTSVALRAGRDPSCGCSASEFQRKKNNLAGKVFGRLKVIEPLKDSGNNRCILWKCLCSCGNYAVISSGSLSGGTMSCGCLQSETTSDRCTSHGHTINGKVSPTYFSWYSMKTRCTNPNAINYKNYGGRGISFCDEWLDFNNFLNDMGVRPDGKSIDRIDVDGNYTPENCKWSTQSEQVRNQRRYKK